MINPFDPLGIGRAVQEQMARAAAQTAEAARQARIAARKADVTTSYAGWLNQPDQQATENLAGAVAAFQIALGE